MRDHMADCLWWPTDLFNKPNDSIQMRDHMADCLWWSTDLFNKLKMAAYVMPVYK